MTEAWFGYMLIEIIIQKCPVCLFLKQNRINSLFNKKYKMLVYTASKTINPKNDEK